MRLARNALVATLAVATWAPPAGAQDRTSAYGAPRALDAQDGEAARLYAEARADLDADRRSEAQRKLEVFVARFPASPLADVARRDLRRLYDLASPATPAPTPSSAAALPRPSAAPARPSLQLAPVAIQVPGPATPAPAIGGSATPMPPQPPTNMGGALSAAVRSASEDFRQQAGDRVFFGDNSADIGGRARLALEAQANWLQRHPNVRVVIEGHADDQGARDLNVMLAEKRAEAVRLRLNDLGVDAGRMRITVHGRNEPVADCPEAHCRAQNRRVVTSIVYVPAVLGFDDAGRRSLGHAAGAVGQPLTTQPIKTTTPPQ